MAILKDIALFGQITPLNMGSISSFGYFDVVPPPDPYNPNLVEDVLNLLIEQLKNKDDLHDFFKILLDPGQDVENTLAEMLRLKSIAYSSDDRLDTIGDIVGEPRNFRIDDVYRTAIYTRIFLNKSSGEGPAVIAGLQAAARTSRIFFNERQPYFLDLCFNTSYPIPDNLLETIEALSMGGVFVQLSTANDNSKDSIAAVEAGFYPEVQDTGGAMEVGFPDASDGASMEVWDYSGLT